MAACGCVTQSDAEAASGLCRQDGAYHGFCWYHRKMFLGLIDPYQPARQSKYVVVKKSGVGRIFPVRKIPQTNNIGS